MDDLLFVIAELAIGLAGFASVATVLARRDEMQLAIAAVRLRVMLVLSIGVAFLSLVPAILAQFEFLPEPRWRLSAALLSALLLVGFLPFSPLRTGFKATRAAGVTWNPIYYYFMGSLLLLPFIACSAVALGVISEFAAGTYVASLTCFLLAAAIAFVRLVFSLLQPKRAA